MRDVSDWTFEGLQEAKRQLKRAAAVSEELLKEETRLGRPLQPEERQRAGAKALRSLRRHERKADHAR